MATAYADKAGGSDSNDGLTFDTAKLTLVAAATVAGLSGTVWGSGQFKEQLTKASATGLVFKQNPGKDQFIIDGRRDLAGVWSDETGCYSTPLDNTHTVACCARGDLTWSPTKGWYFPILKLVADAATCKSTDWSCAKDATKLYVRLSGGGSGTAPVNTGVATALRYCEAGNGLTFSVACSNVKVLGVTFWCIRGTGTYGLEFIGADNCEFSDCVFIDAGELHDAGFVTGPTTNNIASRNVFIGMGASQGSGVIGSGLVFHATSANGAVSGCIEEDSQYVVRGPIDPSGTEIFPAIGQWGMECHGTTGQANVTGLIRRRITVEIQDPGNSGLRFPWVVNDSAAPSNRFDPATFGVRLEDITLINGGSFTVSELGHYSLDRLRGDLLQYGPRSCVTALSGGGINCNTPSGTALTYCTIRGADLLFNTDQAGVQGHPFYLAPYSVLTLLDGTAVDVGTDQTAPYVGWFNWNNGGAWTGIQLTARRCIFIGAARKTNYLNIFDNGLPVAQQDFQDCTYVGFGTFSQTAGRSSGALFVGAGKVDLTGTISTNPNIVLNAARSGVPNHAAEGFTVAATTSDSGVPTYDIEGRGYTGQRGSRQNGPLPTPRRFRIATVAPGKKLLWRPN